MAEATPEQLALINALEAKRGAWKTDIDKFDAYLRGKQPLSFLSDEMREEFGDKITDLVINWPQLVVDTYENRLDVEGFRFPGESEGSEELWAIWQANDMDEQSMLGHVDALGLARACVIVGAPDDPDAVPIITVESALDCAWTRDPRTRNVTAAMKRWTGGDDGKTDMLNLYEPERTSTMSKGKTGWDVVEVDEHSLGVVPLVPLVNRPRIKYPDGFSEIEAIIGLADAANKMATDMMVSGEYHAMPRRWAFGLKRDDFVDANGALKNAWSVIKGRLWANENPDVKVGQFSESDLKNFHDTIRLLAAMVSHLTALPPYYIAFEGGNPTSADAIRASEAPLVKRIERKQVAFGATWEEVMRLCMLIVGGEVPDGAEQLETVWRDPSTPTVAQMADAVTKKVATRGADGRPLIPTEQARIDLGYTPAERQLMTEMERDSLALDPVNAPYLQAPAVSDGAGVS